MLIIACNNCATVTADKIQPFTVSMIGFVVAQKCLSTKPFFQICKKKKNENRAQANKADEAAIRSSTCKF